MTFEQIIQLGDDTVGLVLARRNNQVEFVHFGPALGTLLPTDSVLFDSAVPPSSYDGAVAQHLSPSPLEGWLGTPGLELGRGHLACVPDLRIVSMEHQDDEVIIEQADLTAGITLISTITFHPSGVFTYRHEVRNEGGTPLSVNRLAAIAPISGPAAEIIETTGRWARETHEQRHAFRIGKWVRSTRQGRSGHNAPVLFAVGTRGAGFRSGEIWAAHLAFSSDAEHFVERLPSGEQVIGAELLLGPGEAVLAPGGSYLIPNVVLAYSAGGLDDIARRIHAYVRSQRKRQPRRVTLNSWEAVYFDHDSAKLTEIASLAASIGVERFVLDDGWFLGRRDDTSGLGDWVVDPDVWPRGLHPLVDHVRSLGMDFGLWVEPEMVSPRSNLAEEHPDWISSSAHRAQREWRNQQLLDLTNRAAWDYLFKKISALVREYDISYLKWDMNRDSTTVGSGGQSRTAAQTHAVYAMIDQLSLDFPNLRIENCSSGGGRVDLGLIERTDRVWPSDTNDALERSTIHQWMTQLVPPELLGTHAGAPKAHTTGRHHDLNFRIATSVLFDIGVEWNLLEASESDLNELAEGIAVHKRLRSLVSNGIVVRSDHRQTEASLFGVISEDGRHAVFNYTQLGAGPLATPQPIRFPGLTPEVRYRVSRPLPGRDITLQKLPPEWTATEPTLSGRQLSNHGLHLPLLMPAQSILLEFSEAG